MLSYNLCSGSLNSSFATEISHHELASVKEEGPDSPYHPERLLKVRAGENFPHLTESYNIICPHNVIMLKVK